MAAFTINNGLVTKWDTLTGGSVVATLDTYDISAESTLTIDTDSYQCAGHSAAFGSLDTVSWAGRGGTLRFDGTNVRVIPFNTGAGTVPAIGTAISRSGVSSTLLGVWANWLSEPLAAAAAMPATGFIKVKDKTGGTYSAGALTGISASATGADVVGWIEIRGADTGSMTPIRTGNVLGVGAWFDLGNTNGVRGQVLACPTTATLAGTFPGVFIETAVASGVFEPYPSVGSFAASTAIPTAVSVGKVVWQTTSGIRIGFDGTNNVGFLPASGLRVVIPNIILTCCTRTAAGSGARVLPNATLGTRMKFNTDQAGAVDFTKVASQWYHFFRNAYAVTHIDCAVAGVIQTERVATAVTLTRTLTGVVQAQNPNTYSVEVVNAADVQVDGCAFLRHTLTGGPAIFQNLLTGTIQNTKFMGMTTRTSDFTYACDLRACAFLTLTNNVYCGSKLYMNACTDITVNGLAYVDNWAVVTTTSSNAVYALDVESCRRIKLVGASFPVVGRECWKHLVGNAGGAIKVWQVGTRAAPLAMNAICEGLYRSYGGSPASNNSELKQCWALNERGNRMIYLANGDKNYVIEHVYGQYGRDFGSEFSDTLASTNTVVKSCGHTPIFAGPTSLGAYASIWLDGFQSDTTGSIMCKSNEPNALSGTRLVVIAGTVQYDGNGSVLLTDLNDEVIFEMDYSTRGHTAFRNLAPTFAGSNIANLTITFQWALAGGAYNGTWTTLNAANLVAVGAISNSNGVKVKVRVVCTTANASNAFNSATMYTSTTAIDQDASFFPLSTNTLTISGLISGTRYRVERVSDSLYIGDGTSTGVAIPVIHSLSVSTPCRIIVRKGSAAPKYVPLEQLVTLGDFASSVIITQVPDTNAL